MIEADKRFFTEALNDLSSAIVHLYDPCTVEEDPEFAGDKLTPAVYSGRLQRIMLGQHALLARLFHTVVMLGDEDERIRHDFEIG